MILPYFCTPKNKQTVTKTGENEEDRIEMGIVFEVIDLVAQLVEHPDFNREGPGFEKKKSYL